MTFNPFKLLLACLLTVLVSRVAHAETVYVCEGEGAGGSTLYSEKPCESEDGIVLQFPDSYSIGKGLSDLEKRNLSAIRAREQEEKKHADKNGSIGESKEATLVARPIDQAACDKANADLKQWKKVMSLGYLPEEKRYYLEELQKRTRHRDETCGLSGK